ncbi:MAG: T9SS type A sorting domain-containing protein [Lewinellaceae bacterium]|nr:T9SS type A sorting domain-containing protein [Lewinellaceae bacterium]
MKKLIYTFSFLLFTAVMQAQLPAGWFNSDIGAPGTPGSTIYDGGTGTFTLTGTGLNFWDVDDAQFAYVRIDGDFEFTARLLTLESIDGLGGAAKAGIDARNSLDTDAPSFLMAWEDWGGLAITSREGPGVTPEWTGSNFPGADAIPWYLRVVRVGDDFTGYESQDSVTWNETGVKTMSSMLPTIYVGLAISPNSDNVATATFDGVHITGNILLSDKETPNLNHGLRCFPNPTSGELFYNAGSLNAQQVMISDLSGNVISRYTQERAENRLDVSNLAPGMYLLQLVSEKGMAVQKFVKY